MWASLFQIFVINLVAIILCGAHYIRTSHYYMQNKNDLVCKTLNFIICFGLKHVSTHLTAKKLNMVLVHVKQWWPQGMTNNLKMFSRYCSLETLMTFCKEWWPNNGGGSSHYDSSTQQLFQ